MFPTWLLTAGEVLNPSNPQNLLGQGTVFPHAAALLIGLIKEMTSLHVLPLPRKWMSSGRARRGCSSTWIRQKPSSRKEKLLISCRRADGPLQLGCEPPADPDLYPHPAAVKPTQAPWEAGGDAHGRTELPGREPRGSGTGKKPFHPYIPTDGCCLHVEGPTGWPSTSWRETWPTSRRPTASMTSATT